MVMGTSELAASSAICVGDRNLAVGPLGPRRKLWRKRLSIRRGWSIGFKGLEAISIGRLQSVRRPLVHSGGQRWQELLLGDLRLWSVSLTGCESLPLSLLETETYLVERFCQARSPLSAFR